MSDNYVCRAYKRQKNNPAWAGHYFIVTSNLSFSEWLSNCKIHVNSKHYAAMVSRFYICEIKQKDDGTNYLALRSASDRGSIDEQVNRATMFMEFKKKFNEVMAGYKPSLDTVDYSSMIDDCFKEEDEQHKTERLEAEKQEAEKQKAEQMKQEEFLRYQFEQVFKRKPTDYECSDYEWMKQCIADGVVHPLYNPDACERKY